MEGQILDYSIQKNEGLISSDDGGRYTFSGADWRGASAPTRGAAVDFEAKDGIAVGVYSAIGSGTGSKSKAAAILWGAFLGGFGAHKFYMGSWGWGIIYLLTFWLYIPFLLAMIEWVHYVLLSDDEFQQRVVAYESRGAGGFSWFW
jgi:TM2 domain-containing membrane protein YozV